MPAAVIRAAPTLSIAVMIGPILAGLAGAALPAFGLLPALGGTSLSLEPWRDLFAEPGIGRSIALSLWIGFAATLLSYLLVVGLLAACWGTPLLRWVARLLAPLLSVPHAAAALGLAFLIAPSGWIARLLSPELTGWMRPPDLLIVNDRLGLGAILGLALKEAPFLLLMALAALPQLDAERGLRLGRSFGYGRIAAFVFIVLPPLGRQIRLPVFAVLAFAASNVEVATILGPTTPPTLAVRLVAWLADPDLSRRFVASAGALVQLAVVVVLIAGWAALAGFAGRLAAALCGTGRRFARDGPVRVVAASLAGLSGAAAFASLGGLVLWSLAGPWRFPDAWPASLTTAHWTGGGAGFGAAFAATVTIALAAAAIAIVLATLSLEAEERRGRSIAVRTLPIVYLPLIVPQVVFLFGLDVLFLVSGLPPTIATVVLAHLVFVLPYVFLALADPWRAFDRRFSQAALSLGASPNRVFARIRLPLLAQPVLVAFAIGVAVSVGLYLPTLLIGGGRIATVTTEAVALSASGDRRLIGILVVLQMAIPLAAFSIARTVPRLMFGRRAAGYAGASRGAAG